MIWRHMMLAVVQVAHDLGAQPEALRPPAGPGVRDDSGVYEGWTVPFTEAGLVTHQTPEPAGLFLLGAGRVLQPVKIALPPQVVGLGGLGTELPRAIKDVPRPLGLMSRILSESRMASEMLCVTKRTVAPVTRRMSRRRSFISRRVSSSSAPNGLSISSLSRSIDCAKAVFACLDSPSFLLSSPPR